MLDPTHVNQEEFLGLIGGQYGELENLWIALKGQLDVVGEIWEYIARKLDGVHMNIPADLLESLVRPHLKSCERSGTNTRGKMPVDII